MRFDTLEGWLSWLETLHPSSIEMGLDRLHRVLDRLPELSRLEGDRNARIVTVAGTNGKGSCVATLESFCLAANQTVGAYTSPHFLRYNERIRINGEPASDRQIMAAFQQVDAARGDTSLTYFEFGTLAALLLFVQAGVDHLLLEVGLGGRLDAVNVVDPDVAVVTGIDLDHQTWLGNNRETIGREKAGIFRRGQPAICVDPDPPESLLATAGEREVELLLSGRDLSWSAESDRWSWQGLDRHRQTARYAHLPLPRLPLPSVAAALQAFVLLGYEPGDREVATALRALELPGRCQRLCYQNRELILDVAHNPAAASYLAERLGPPTNGRRLAVTAVMADKDYPAMMKALSPAVDEWFVCGLPDNPRAAAPDLLLKAVRSLGQPGQSCDSVAAGMTAALDKAGEDDQILVAGSFYTVAAVLTLVGAEQ